MMAFKVMVALLISVKLATCSGPIVQEALAKVLGTWTPYTNVRTMQLLNQLCNESQKESIMRRDACYGCFFRVTNQPSGYPMLLAMASCADTYLNNTDYGHCQSYLRNATINITSRTNPNIVYCTFLECVRQANKDMLIRECVGEALLMFSSFNGTDNQLAQLFTNTTACILAKTRCSYSNPITGTVQEDDIGSNLHRLSRNALQVNSDYDINIVQLPLAYGKGDECAKYRNINQAIWPTVDC